MTSVVGPVRTWVAKSVKAAGGPSTKTKVWRLSSARSGTPWTVVGSEAASFAAYGSPVVATVAVLVTLGTAAGAAFTVRSNTRLSPTAIGPLCVAVTVPPASAKLQPAPAPET